MRALIVALSRFSAPTGIWRYADMVGNALSRFGAAQTTIAIGRWQEPYFAGVFKADSHSQLVSVDIENSPASRNIWSLTKLPDLARRFRADIVHLAYPIPFVQRFFPCPAVVTVHDLYAFDAPKNFSFPIANRMLLKLALRQSGAIVCISDSTLDRLDQVFPDIRQKQIVTRIYNPITTPQMSPGQQVVFGLRPSQFVLSVGQHRSNKNLDLLQKSFVRLRSAQQISTDCRLVIVGSEGPETGPLHRLTEELGLTGNVLYLSSISESELAWLYRNCLVMVVPSHQEGLCMPLVEALSSGSRVVCSDIPVLREVGRNACTYFQIEGDSVQSLADAILQSIASPIHKETSNNIFAPYHAAQELSRLYRAVIEKRDFSTLHPAA